jgi:putative FmdB family regulatory protein
MPIYEYLCGSCKKMTEVIQGMNDPRLRVCPHCGGKLTKAFSAPAIQFKGSGFYITDYARGTGDGATKNTDAKSESDRSSEKAEKADKAEKSESSERSEKSEKPEKSEKSERSESAGKSEKVEKKAETKDKKEKKGKN